MALCCVVGVPFGVGVGLTVVCLFVWPLGRIRLRMLKQINSAMVMVSVIILFLWVVSR